MGLTCFSHFLHTLCSLTDVKDTILAIDNYLIEHFKTYSFVNGYAFRWVGPITEVVFIFFRFVLVSDIHSILTAETKSDGADVGHFNLSIRLVRMSQLLLLLCLHMCSSRSCRWPRLGTPPCCSHTPAAQTILLGGWMTKAPQQSRWCSLQCICCWETKQLADPASRTGCGGWTSCGHHRSSQLWCSDQSLQRAGFCCEPENNKSNKK